MSGTFTPGPWMVNKYGSVGAGEFGTRPIIAEVQPFYGTDTEYGDHAANRHLIAAAPDLLAALIELAELAGGFNVSGVYFNEFSDESNALAHAWTAVAKARGEL